MAPSVVIFDIDNTLYNYTDGNEAGMAALSDYAREHLHVDSGLFLAYTKEGYELYARRMKGLAASHSRLLRFQYVCRKLGIPDYPYAMELAKLYWDTLLKTAKPEPGLMELLKALKEAGIRIVMGTNMTAPVQFEKLKVLGVGPYTDLVITSEEAGAEKPFPEFFRYVAETLTVSPSQCIFIGDDAKNDYTASEKAGMSGIWYAARPGFRPELEAGIPEGRILRSYIGCVQEDGIHLGGFVIERCKSSLAEGDDGGARRCFE